MNRLAGLLLVGLLAACSADTQGSATVPTSRPVVGTEVGPIPTGSLEPTPMPAPATTPADESAISTAPVDPTSTSTSTPTPTPTPRPTASPTPTPEPAWSLEIREIDGEVRARIEPTSWRPGCPVGLEDLRLLTFPHVTFDGDVAMGELIVATEVAEQIGAVFRRLFEAGYPIQRIELVDAYGGDDLISMQANNTSAFNCREVAGRPGVWSNHALGLALDLNPLMNPLVSGNFVDPPEGAEFLDREDGRLGMILPGDEAVQAFAAMGWRWGGDWTGLKDYQHFSHNGR